MTLKKWLELPGTPSAVGLAKLLGVSFQIVYQWRAGASRPSLIHAVKIQAITGGAVTPADFVTVAPQP